MNEFDLSQYEQRASSEEVSSSADVRALIGEVRRLYKVVGVNPPVGDWQPSDDQKLDADVAPDDADADTKKARKSK